jgi:hypothetical protein
MRDYGPRHTSPEEQPTRAEARRDEAALRRRGPIPRDRADGNTDLLDALARSVSTVKSIYRNA